MKPLFLFRVTITGYYIAYTREGPKKDGKKVVPVKRYASWTRIVLHHTPQQAGKLVRKDYARRWESYTITRAETTQLESKPRLLEGDWQLLEGEE